jgi:putative membrane protein
MLRRIRKNPLLARLIAMLYRKHHGSSPGRSGSGRCHTEGDASMFRLLIHWLLSAIALMIVSRIVPGFFVTGLQSAMIAAVVIGFLNATLGFLLKLITFPLAILTFGIFLLVINAAMILLTSQFVGGFTVYGWGPAFWGATVLAILSMIFRVFAKE